MCPLFRHLVRAMESCHPDALEHHSSELCCAYTAGGAAHSHASERKGGARGVTPWLCRLHLHHCIKEPESRIPHKEHDEVAPQQRESLLATVCDL